MLRLQCKALFIFALTLMFSLVLSCAPGAQSSSLTLTDDLGRTVHVSQAPQRIVSLSPSNTEILFALGLGDRVVGVTEFCNVPPEVEIKPRVGGFSNVDLEKVVALNPDLILAAGKHKITVIPELERRGLMVFALTPQSLEGVLRAIRAVGEITGAKGGVSRLIAEMEDRTKVVTEKTERLPSEERPRVFYITWHDPLRTSGRGTLTHDLIQKAGGDNIAADLSGWKIIGLETVIARDPQVIVACTGHGEAKGLPFEWAKSEPRLKDTEARRNGRVYFIDADLITRPGPRIVDALEQLARFIHPEMP